MKKISLLVLLLLIALSAAAQVREKKVTADDFDGLVAQGKTAYHSGEYSACIDLMRRGISLAAGMMHQAVIDAMPAAPPGFTKVPIEKQDLDDALGGAMAGSFGLVIEQRYRQDDGDGSIEIKATANSPIVGMIEGMFRLAGMNPAMEVVSYGEHKATFESKDDGERLELQMPIFSKHMINGSATNVSEALFFQLFSQKTVDDLAAALGK